MDPVASALMWGLFVPLVGDNPILPEVPTIQLRMKFLKPGMSEEDVQRVIGRRNYWIPGTVMTVHFMRVAYALEAGHKLFLLYSHDGTMWRLSDATLAHGAETIASLRVRPKDTPERPKDPPDQPMRIPDRPMTLPDRPMRIPDRPMTVPDE